jgi:hypothetical protein
MTCITCIIQIVRRSRPCYDTMKIQKYLIQCLNKFISLPHVLAYTLMNLAPFHGILFAFFRVFKVAFRMSKVVGLRITVETQFVGHFASKNVSV